MSDTPSNTGKKAERPNAGVRREGREAAIQYLFQLDFQESENTSPEADFWKLRAGAEDPDELNPVPARPPIAPKARAFAEALLQGVCAHKAELDERITRYARNYRLSRLAAVDRNILRLAVYEMFHTTEVPPVVAINEAIELAKQYGSEESGGFVNGLLDKMRAELKRPAREADRPRRAQPQPSEPAPQA
jgi:N utilization substance protein B